MSEHPIIFSGPMVRAILEGRKTMTRRPIKWGVHGTPWQNGGVWYDARLKDSENACVALPGGYRKGDLLWVKETWQWHIGKGIGIDYRSDEKRLVGPWRSPIFMPRAASRITLEVTRDSWPQRVQDITNADAIAEGMVDCGGGAWQTMTAQGDYVRCVSPIHTYQALWDSLYAKKPEYQWAANPWVWVHEFRRVTP